MAAAYRGESGETVYAGQRRTLGAFADLFDLTVAQVEQALRFELTLARTA
ncbi:MAG: hypothetical protein ACRDRO_19875 [Pseudonocardiaceae bacterium]